VPRYADAFSHEPRLRALAARLAGCVEEPQLSVHYAEGEGTITLGGRWTGSLTCAGRALAGYRDELALFEPRLATFRLQLAVGDCILTLAGQVPPDGSTFSACVQKDEPCPPSLRGIREQGLAWVLEEALQEPRCSRA
jgi:hypothetical protein